MAKLLARGDLCRTSLPNDGDFWSLVIGIWSFEPVQVLPTVDLNCNLFLQLAQHLFQQFQRQTDYVRLAPRDNSEPAVPILITKGACFSFPQP